MEAAQVHGVAALPVRLHRVRLPRAPAGPRGRDRAAARTTRTRPSRRTRTGGRSWSPSGSACTTPDEFGIEPRIVRFHNIYGPYGTYDGGREKVPAALCRKVALAEPGGTIEVWGDGEQTRSFCYVDDCVEGIHRIMRSDYARAAEPGHRRMVTINELAQLVIDISGKAGIELATSTARRACAGATRTTRGCARSSGGSRRISLEDGLEPTYRWIAEQVQPRTAGSGLDAADLTTAGHGVGR